MGRQANGWLCPVIITINKGWRGNANTDIAVKITYNTKIVALIIIFIKLLRIVEKRRN